MEPRISFVTLGVADLERSIRFYRDVLELPVVYAGGDVCFFELGKTWLALYPRNLLAEDAGVENSLPGFPGMTLAHNVRSPEEVDALLAHAAAGGGRMLRPGHRAEWGGYTGYFADPDGFLWEVAWNPKFPTSESRAVDRARKRSSLAALARLYHCAVHSSRNGKTGWIALGLAVFALVVGCRPPAPEPRQTLWHGEPAFDLLVESRLLAPPPSLSGNRFVSGWRGWRDGARVVYAPTRDTARLEIVNLGGRARDLVLDVEGLRAEDAGRRVTVVAAGRSLGEVPLTAPLRVPLAADLPLGRVALDLTFAGPLTVTAAGLSSALPAGNARLDGQDLVQKGDSLVEVFLDPPPVVAAAPAPTNQDEGRRLVGQILPPSETTVDQSFEVSVADQHGEATGTFRWTPGREAKIDFVLPLPAAGPARVRLLARGAGGEARWRALRVEPPVLSAAAIAAAPSTAPPAPPKLIVVFLLDALRADAVGHLGAGEDRTPEIDRLASEGVTFTAHRSVAPNTLPSTKSLFTGRTWRAGGGLALAADVPTLAELMRAAGYRTACVSGNQNVSSSFDMTRGFDFDAEGVKFPPPRSSRNAPFNDNAARARAAAVAWIHSLAPGERGFLYVHVIHPHNPYDPPAALARKFTNGIPSRIDGATETLRAIDRGDRATTAADQKRLRALYAASLRYADGELAALVAEAERGREPGELLVAVTADHGEELFDHGGLLHGYTLFEEMLRIPLVLWWPGRLAPARVARPTDTLDLFATLLEAAGAHPPAGSGGHSLLTGASTAFEPRFAAASAVRGGIFGVTWGGLKVVVAPRAGLHWGMGSGIGRVRDAELVFDLERDPGETTNLAGNADVRAGWLRAELLRWIAAGGPEPAEPGAQPALDAEARRRLKALGYIGN